MYPWQLGMIEKLKGFKPGEMVIHTAGRNVGKSVFSAQALKRVMDDVLAQPVTDIRVTENRVHGARYYCAEPVGGNWHEMKDWCFDKFGDVGNNIAWTDEEKPKCWRWYMNNRKFWFRNEADLTMFLLRWR